MKNKKLLCIAMMATPLLFACGGSDSSSNDSNSKGDNPDPQDVKASIAGTWLSPSCEYGTYYPDTATNDYERTLLTIDETSITTADNVYSDADCKTVVSSTEKSVTFEDEGATTGEDTGFEMRKISTSSTDSPNKWLGYVTPSANHLILTPGSTTFPVKMSLDTYFVKQGADLSANTSGSTIAVLGHFGLNLKTGLEEESEGTNDLATTVWSPSSKYVTGEDYGSGIWLREYSNADNFYVYPTGETSFSEVTSLPSAWPVVRPSDDSVAIPSAKKGEVNIVKLRDGTYAKLKVLNTPNPESDNWPLLIEYQFMSE